jgi:hypothetical protein
MEQMVVPANDGSSKQIDILASKWWFQQMVVLNSKWWF